MNKFYLPQIEKLSIFDYSLYCCPLIIDFSKKLSIIYGTNGIGKSTLLMILLFSVIGPYRGGIKTKVRQEQRRDNRPIYGDHFFKDRMAVTSGSDAVVISEFLIHKDKYIVKHSLDDGRLLSVEVNGRVLDGKIVSYRTYEDKYTKQRADGSMANNDLEEYLIYKYHNQIKTSSELPGGINTLISMLRDVMFFDESRKLTFWNSDLQETIVGKYIVDAEFYEKYCEQKLETKALESAYKKKSETLNYMNKFFAKEKREREEALWTDNDKLHAELIQLENEVDNLEQSLNDRRAAYTRENRELLNCMQIEEQCRERLRILDEKWYENLFPNQYNMYHERFIGQISDGICPICGKRHQFDVDIEHCIMCGELLIIKKELDVFQIDVDRRNYKEKHAEIKAEIQSRKDDLGIINNEIDQLREHINQNNVRIGEIKAHLNPDEDNSADSDRKRLDKARKEREEARLEYSVAREREETMRKKIEDNLVDNFSILKENFLNYAASFFGNAHKTNLRLPFQNSDAFGTLLIKFDLDGKERSDSEMLSESQRIFTDFSFRFAVLSTFHKNSFFICETPDSTLDVFHENQAVKTFENFIKSGNNLILSANARQSTLVSMLYDLFDPEDITLVDLTQISKLALPADYSFNSYVKGEKK